MPSGDPTLIVLVEALIAVTAITASLHALINKREPAVAFGWIAVCILFPLAGPLLYAIFGIDRIQRRARELSKAVRTSTRLSLKGPSSSTRRIVKISDAVTGVPLLSGNQVRPLRNGDEAFPAMLEAIDSARQWVYLSSYIFGGRGVAERFVDALVTARERGVEVRVLIDGVGQYYSWPRAGAQLAKRGVRVSRFIPPRILPLKFAINLRNHRKILLVDGRVGFIGGMNIDEKHIVAGRERLGVIVDTHFQVSGPVLEQIYRIANNDWFYATGEMPPERAMASPPEGSADCRAFPDGPDEDEDKLHMVLLGAISSAETEIAIMSPYFLPPPSVVVALQLAALRGVRITIVLPRENNWQIVRWAANNTLSQLVRYGIRVCLQPPPFVHTKLLIVDRGYSLLGSANLDYRSLRLNFEIGLEVHEPALANLLHEQVARAAAVSQTVTEAALAGRSYPVRLRDAACWLFTPYL